MLLLSGPRCIFIVVVRNRTDLILVFSDHNRSFRAFGRRAFHVRKLFLSQGRAKSVYEYLISKGIAAERLSHKGFGETQPEISDEEIEVLIYGQPKSLARPKVGSVCSSR